MPTKKKKRNWGISGGGGGIPGKRRRQGAQKYIQLFGILIFKGGRKKKKGEREVGGTCKQNDIYFQEGLVKVGKNSEKKYAIPRNTYQKKEKQRGEYGFVIGLGQSYMEQNQKRQDCKNTTKTWKKKGGK